MSCYVYGSRTTSAIFALAAGGCLVVSGTTAARAADESSTKTDEGWSTQVRAGDTRVTTAAIETNAKKVDAPSKKKVSAPTEKKIDDKTAEPAAAKRKDAGDKKDLFQPDPQYEKKYSVEEQVDIYGFLIRNLGIKLEP